MTSTANIHGLTSGMLLTALAVTTVILVQKVHGETTFDTYGASEDSSLLCPTELAACVSDSTCTSCFADVSYSSTEFTECRTALGHDEITSSTATCAHQIEVICCHDEAAEDTCLDNNEFVGYYICLLESVGCTDEEITCSGASSSVSSGSTGGGGATPTMDDITYDDSSSVCSAEFDACKTDGTCASCILTATERSDEISECRIALGYGEIDSYTTVCSDNIDFFCCLDEVAEQECLDDDEFAEYSRCLLGSMGCTDEGIACDGESSSFAGASSTAGDVVTHADADTTNDSTPVCSTEIDACGADDTCTRCMLVAVESSEEIYDCRTSLHLDEAESSTAACSDYMEVVCCHDEIAEDDCLDNDGFVEYHICLLESVGCADKEIACTGATSSNNAGASTTSGTTTPPTTDYSTDDFVPATGLTADGTTGDSTSACSTEADACGSDSTCASCFLAVVESSEEVGECLTALGLDEVESSVVSCSDHMDLICCQTDVAENDDCLDNNAFVEIAVCFLEQEGCTDDEIVCSGAGSGFRSPSYAVVFLCTFAVLLPLLLQT